MEHTIKNLILTIQQIKDNGVFSKYIDYIRFPLYRNLLENTKITFDFPFTVFVGQNGCGKSSTLHALFGSPDGKSVGNFWFSTKVDPIEESGGRPALIYSYVNEDGERGEVLKTRIKKGSNPDYWEPSRPLRKYDMELMGGDRFPALKMEVLYLDFRSILSAFDKYFYYGNPVKLKSTTKQDYLRKKSVSLKKVIDDNSVKMAGSRPQNEVPIEFSPDELKVMSFILGKNYEKGKLIEHKFFAYWGNSILFGTPNLDYSEAFAGSGESAVAILVHELLNVGSNSLILLDEPEMSLHPGAQKRLKQFILEQIKEKHLQVVISTHSPSMIEDLPSSAIKVFTQLPNGIFCVENKRLPEEAFFYIGQANPLKKKIIVEDKLAKRLIEEVIKSVGEDCASLFDVEFHPGGHSIIKSDFIKVYSQNVNNNEFVIFDGDQKLVETHFDVGDIPSSYFGNSMQDTLIECLKEKIETQTNSKIDFHPDGNSDGGNKGQLIELMKMYLVYYRDNVFYLPQMIPESIIWDDDYAIQHLKIMGLDDQSIIDDIISITDYKLKIKKYSKLIFGSENIPSTHGLFLNNWINNPDENYRQVVEIVNAIKNS